MKLYFKGRYFYYNQGACRYTLDYLFNQQRSDYNVSIKTYDLGTPKNFVLVEFTEYDIEDIRYDFNTFYKPLFNLAELTKEQAISFLEATYTQTSPGVFLVSESTEFSKPQYITL